MSPQNQLYVLLLFALAALIAAIAGWRAATRTSTYLIELKLEINGRMNELLKTTQALARAEGVAWQRDQQEAHPPDEVS